MGDAYYFISDVHLGLESPEREKQKEINVVNFLKEAEGNAKEIFIVGDLFDCWIEYKYVVPKGYYRLFTKISELVEKGIVITYLAGNHDFWKGDFFKKEFGIEIHYTEIIREINGKKFFIHHGDGFAYNDFGYRILKKVLRNKVCQKLYSYVHPDIGIWLAKSSSETSRSHTSEKDYSQKDGLKDFASLKIDEGFDYVILGHRHKPEFERINNGFYINLGDWIDFCTYGIFFENRFELRKFSDISSYDTTEFKNSIS